MSFSLHYDGVLHEVKFAIDHGVLEDMEELHGITSKAVESSKLDFVSNNSICCLFFIAMEYSIKLIFEMIVEFFEFDFSKNSKGRFLTL